MRLVACLPSVYSAARGGGVTFVWRSFLETAAPSRVDFRKFRRQDFRRNMSDSKHSSPNSLLQRKTKENRCKQGASVHNARPKAGAILLGRSPVWAFR